MSFFVWKQSSSIQIKILAADYVEGKMRGKSAYQRVENQQTPVNQQN